MRTLLTGKQGTPALCPANRAFLLFLFLFLGGVHFFNEKNKKKNKKKLYIFSFFSLFLSLFLSCTHTLGSF
jgi:hypothetical protein